MYFPGEHFGIEHQRTWEFDHKFPLRSQTVSSMLLKTPLMFLDFFAVNIRDYLGFNIINSYTLIVFPRLIMCILSLFNDWSLLKICRIYGLRHEIRLLALGSSYVMLVYSTRTFSNSVEMALVSILLLLVAECMINTNSVVYKKEYLDERTQSAKSVGEKVKIWKMRNNLPAHNYSNLFLICTLCTIGIFNRPTFVLFCAPILFFWNLRGLGTKTVTIKVFNIRMLFFIATITPAIFFFVVFDSLYYKYLTTGEILMKDISLENFVVTPINFIKYNINSTNTALHGTHPKYLHVLVNIPLLFNVLGILGLFSIVYLSLYFMKADFARLPRSQSIMSLMYSSIIVPVAGLSYINHQEPRFLLPITLPVILLQSPKLATGLPPSSDEKFKLKRFYENIVCKIINANFLMKSWFTINLSLVIFYGFLHQGGIFRVIQHMEQTMETKPLNLNVHLATSHIYNIPISLIHLPNSNIIHTDYKTGKKYQRAKEFFLHEYGSLEIETVLMKIKLMLDICEVRTVQKGIRCRMFLAIPESLRDEMDYKYRTNNNTYNFLQYEAVKVFYPHISTEALPQFSFSHDYFKSILNYVQQFGLGLYKFQLKRRQ